MVTLIVERVTRNGEARFVTVTVIIFGTDFLAQPLRKDFHYDSVAESGRLVP